MPVRGLYRRFAPRVRAGRVVIDLDNDTTPAMEPLYIYPSAAPATAGVKGSLYFDSTANTLYAHDGTAYRAVPLIAGAVVAGLVTLDDLTVNDDLSIGDDLNLTSTGAIITIGPAATNPVTITQSADVLTLSAGDKIVSPLMGFGVETGGGAATLTAAQSGGVFAFNAAAGFLYTLPAAVAGLMYTFVVETTVTSGVARVACASGDFLLGTILQGTDGTFVLSPQDANGTTHLAWEGNGTTTGGIKGDFFSVVAISGTQWRVWGLNTATGTEATPFKTS